MEAYDPFQLFFKYYCKYQLQKIKKINLHLLTGAHTTIYKKIITFAGGKQRNSNTAHYMRRFI